ncbi:AMIN domain-containing protein [bacterium]|nr:AMIN domain-containing protein [bacterium]
MLKNPLTILVLTFMLMLNFVSFAKEATLASVLISKTASSKYELNIKASEIPSYKKTVVDENNIYFDLKNSKLSDTTDTFYNNAQDIEGLIVKQNDPNTVRIYVKGADVQNTDLTFVKTAPLMTSFNEQKSDFNPMWIMVVVLFVSLIAALKSLNSKISYTFEDVEMVRTKDNTRNLKLTIAQISKENMRKKMQAPNKKDFSTSYKRMNLKNKNKSAKNVVKV